MCIFGRWQATMHMQRIFASTGLAAILLAGCATSSRAQAVSKPAGVLSGPDIPYPIRSVADGVVVADVSLDATGAVAGVNVVRDIPSLTSAVTSSIPSWKFTPALFQGKPVPSVLRIAAAFRPPAYFATGPVFSPVPSQGVSDHTRPAETVPGIIAAAYPQYPVNAAMPGTVIIQITVGRSGAVQRTKLVRDAPPFSHFALDALNLWRLQAATLDSEPVPANLVIAFVFAPLPAE